MNSACSYDVCANFSGAADPHFSVPQRPTQPPVDQDTRLREVFSRLAACRTLSCSAAVRAFWGDSTTATAFHVSHATQIGYVLTSFNPFGRKSDRLLGVDLVIDVGANLGQFVAGIRGFYCGEVVSFEPVPEVFVALERLVHTDPAWRCSDLALGRACGEGTLHICTSHDFSSLLAPNAYCARRFGEEASVARTVPMRVSRLDRALQALDVSCEGRRVFLRMDTQGYDLEVFAGAGACLETVVAMQSELSLIPLYAAMPHWLHSLAAYEAVGFGVADLYPVTRETERVIEYDCLLVRTG